MARYMVFELATRINGTEMVVGGSKSRYIFYHIVPAETVATQVEGRYHV